MVGAFARDIPLIGCSLGPLRLASANAVKKIQTGHSTNDMRGISGIMGKPHCRLDGQTFALAIIFPEITLKPGVFAAHL